MSDPGRRPQDTPPTHCFMGGRAGEWAEEWAQAHSKHDVSSTSTSSDAGSYQYVSAWERCLVEILARLVTAKEYTAPARASLRRVARAAGVRWTLLTTVEDELATVLKTARTAGEGSWGTCDSGGGVGSGGGGGGGGGRGGWGDGPEGGAGGGAGGGGGGGSGVSDDSSTMSTLGKWLQVGGAATLGGVALVLTGGLAAPAVVGIIAGLGATGGILGVAATGVAATVAAIGGTVAGSY